MSPRPLYGLGAATPAFHLCYSWTGWLAQGELDGVLLESVAARAAPAWESDGLRLFAVRSVDRAVQLGFRATVDVDPITIAARAKGRLQHAIRAEGGSVQFARTTSVRSVGNNTTVQVEQYIASQVAKSQYLDPRWRSFLQELIFIDPSVDLSQPTRTASGRYWYNLHVVFVMAERRPIHDRRTLRAIRQELLRVADRRGHRTATLSVMPDHIHMALRGALDASPAKIAFQLQNNVAYLLGQRPIWQPGYYAGTFTDYDLNAIRHLLRE